MYAFIILKVCTGMCGLRGVIQEVNGTAVKEGTPWSESNCNAVQQAVPQPV